MALLLLLLLLPSKIFRSVGEKKSVLRNVCALQWLCFKAAVAAWSSFTSLLWCLKFFDKEYFLDYTNKTEQIKEIY